MDIKQLECFVQVAETGSISLAAAALSLAQPAASRRIQALESELGVRLLQRTGRGVTLTEAGAALLPRSKAILAEIDRTRHEITSVDDNPSGIVRLAMTPTASNVMMVSLVRNFRARYPNVRLQISEGYSGTVQEWLLQGRADVGIVATPSRQTQLLGEPLIEESLCLVGQLTEELHFHGDAVPMRRLGEIPLLLPTRTQGLRILLDKLAIKIGLELNPVIEIDDLPGLINLVSDGAGFTVLSAAVVQSQVEQRRLRTWKIVEPEVIRSVSLVTSNAEYYSNSVRVLCQCIKDEAIQYSRRKGWPGGRLLI